MIAIVGAALIAAMPTPEPLTGGQGEAAILMLLTTDRGLAFDYVAPDACRNAQELLAMGYTLEIDIDGFGQARIEAIGCEYR